MLVFFALGNAKVLSFALADAKVPNASSFAFWWNIGFKLVLILHFFWDRLNGSILKTLNLSNHSVINIT